MLTVNSNVSDAINKNTSLNIGIGCILDINCNLLLDFEDTNFNAADLNAYTKNLFPKQSPVKPFRPEQSGVKYAILGDIGTNTWTDPKNIEYKPGAGNTYRTYMVTKKTPYKHYLAKNTMSYGVTYYSSGAVTKNNKRVPCNKVVLKFETAYSTPTDWSISINGTNISASVAKTIPSTGQLPGVITLYYNGTTWSTNPSSISYTSYVMVSNMSVSATASSYIGLIEIAPHWVTDLNDNLIGFNISKEISQSKKDLLPIKDLTANSVSVTLNGFGTSMSSSKYFKSYSKYDTVEMNPASFKYLINNAELYPFYKFYHASGTDGSDSKGTYYKVSQGKFYINEFSISEFGDTSAFGLDGCKILQETIAPQTVCHDRYSAFAIIRKILDISGFTNYNFNYNGKTDSSINDSSIIAPQYWWSDGNSTLWDVIQKLCLDMQMSVVMDENNVLQFYSREYMFDRTSKTISTTFRYDQSGDNLSNIVTFESYDIPTVIKNKIIYNNFDYSAGNSLEPIISITNKKIISGSLQNQIANESTPVSTTYIQLDIVSEINPNIQGGAKEFLEDYNGYLLIDSEIIEYDAKQYQFKPKDPVQDIPDSGVYKTVWVSTPNDFAKWKGRAQEVSITNVMTQSTMIPTGNYRIKTRGAFGTAPAAHNPKPAIGTWSGRANVTWRST